MSGNRLSSDRTDPRSGPRQDNLALRWESATGEARILAKGAEALALYQSDMVEGFRGVTGGFMALGRIQDDGSFRTLIRQAIPQHIAAADVIVIESDTTGPGDEAIAVPDGETIAEADLLVLVIDPMVVRESDLAAELLA